jgi:hypothetical protein
MREKKGEAMGQSDYLISISLLKNKDLVVRMLMERVYLAAKKLLKEGERLDFVVKMRGGSKEARVQLSSLRLGQLQLIVTIGDDVLTFSRSEGDMSLALNNRDIELYTFDEALEIVDGAVELLEVAHDLVEKESERVKRVLFEDGRFAEVRSLFVSEKLERCGK